VASAQRRGPHGGTPGGLAHHDEPPEDSFTRDRILPARVGDRDGGHMLAHRFFGLITVMTVAVSLIRS
jgi:hypothetical protein